MPEVKVPELAESITEGTIAEWLKNVGDSVEKGEAILELETDKVNVEVVSEEAGVLSEQLASEGDTVEVGQAIAVIGEGSGNASKENSNDNTPQQNEETNNKKEETTNKSADNAEVNQTNDVVRKEDIDKKQQAPASTQTTQQAPAKEEKKYNQYPTKPVIREKMSRRKKTAAKKLLEVSNNTAMLTTFNEVDMTNVMELRKRKKEQFMKDHDGTKLGFMSFFTKASVAALKKYPEVNAEIDGDDMITKQYYDIGVAVSTDDGLLVPFVRDCDKKNFAEIEAEIANLAVKAREKKLGLDDMVNGSFTITNGGIFGSMMSTPIINGNQAAILGMHSIITRPIAIDQETIENRPMMYIALSYDHRIIDGKEAVGFLKTIKELIENPEDLLLES
ncbi:TPA: dihydrolipoyllysine-residue succinyltransferase [Staphylococcus aureus]|nr:dihydrolipoyllysine-residue succinyltransferase [Staphylococcus aureus]